MPVLPRYFDGSAQPVPRNVTDGRPSMGPATLGRFGAGPRPRMESRSIAAAPLFPPTSATVGRSARSARSALPSRPPAVEGPGTSSALVHPSPPGSSSHVPSSWRAKAEKRPPSASTAPSGALPSFTALAAGGPNAVPSTSPSLSRVPSDPVKPNSAPPRLLIDTWRAPGSARTSSRYPAVSTTSHLARCKTSRTFPSPIAARAAHSPPPRRRIASASVPQSTTTATMPVLLSRRQCANIGPLGPGSWRPRLEHTGVSPTRAKLERSGRGGPLSGSSKPSQRSEGSAVDTRTLKRSSEYARVPRQESPKLCSVTRTWGCPHRAMFSQEKTMGSVMPRGPKRWTFSWPSALRRRKRPTRPPACSGSRPLTKTAFRDGEGRGGPPSPRILRCVSISRDRPSGAPKRYCGGPTAVPWLSLHQDPFST
mmetsp:Transcript_162/g.670  ORF Transcript_162/g.670 Transcript_162/m.670 type:complete len:424 (+) Transcript_162:2550-3821(+)